MRSLVLGGLGTDEDGLLRTILMPSQSQLKAAARILHEVYKEDLPARVKQELWGNVSKGLQAYTTYVLAHAPDTNEEALAGPIAPTDPTQQVAVAQSQQKHGGLPTAAKVGVSDRSHVWGL